MLWIACTHPHACAHVPQRGHRQTQARHSAQCQYELRPGVHRGIVNTGSLTSAHDCLKHKQHAAETQATRSAQEQKCLFQTGCRSVCFRRDAGVLQHAARRSKSETHLNRGDTVMKPALPVASVSQRCRLLGRSCAGKRVPMSSPANTLWMLPRS